MISSPNNVKVGGTSLRKVARKTLLNKINIGRDNQNAVETSTPIHRMITAYHTKHADP